MRTAHLLARSSQLQSTPAPPQSSNVRWTRCACWHSCETRTVVSATRITIVSEKLPLRHGCSKQQSEWQVIYCAGRRVLTRRPAIKWRRISQNTLSTELSQLPHCASVSQQQFSSDATNRSGRAFQPSKHSVHLFCDNTVTNAAVCSLHLTWGGTVIELTNYLILSAFRIPPRCIWDLPLLGFRAALVGTTYRSHFYGSRIRRGLLET